MFVLATRGGGDVGLVPVDTTRRWTGEVDAGVCPRAKRGNVYRFAPDDDACQWCGHCGQHVSEHLWPTPRASDGARGSDPKGIRDGTPGLVDAVRQWPTPTGSVDSGSEGYSTASGRHSGTTLTDAVRPWATITASEDKGRRVSLARRDDPDMLTEQVRPWATPSCNDFKGSTQEGQRRGQLSEHAALGKRLAPEWVEALMALPVGWTDTDGPRLTVDRNAPAVRGRYPEGWDRTRPWPEVHARSGCLTQIRPDEGHHGPSPDHGALGTGTRSTVGPSISATPASSAARSATRGSPEPLGTRS